MRKTKVVATVGPATDSEAVLERLMVAGVDVFRLNTSHSGPEDLERRLAAIRAVSKHLASDVAVMLDLAGPKLRVGEVEAGTILKQGATFYLVSGSCVGDPTRSCVSYEELAADVREGDRLLLDDGRIELEVTATGEGAVRTEVVVGGPLSSNKGVNVPGVTLNVDPITAHDREMLAWGIEHGVDLVAQSFIRSASDVRQLRELMAATPLPIVAKIEKHEAIADIDGIVDASDAVMVARGDLGVETSAEEVPVLQRRIISACRDRGVPVIVATQMLESMTTSPRPTRAEASDVANAIFDRVDAVMLSAETAIGEYPVESVSTMVRIIEHAEGGAVPESVTLPRSGSGDVTGAMSAAVCAIAEDLGLAAIVTATQSGATARAVARHRPHSPIVAVTPHGTVARALRVVWGVVPLEVPLAESTDEMLDVVVSSVRREDLVGGGSRVAITAGLSGREPGKTDFVVVREVP